MELEMNPIEKLKICLDKAEKLSMENWNAMTLATATKEGFPSARIVLYKDLIDEKIIFYTNYHSRKGLEILENPNVAMVFYWEELGTQIRIRGIAKKTSRELSEKYFKLRPIGSQISAIVSKQSQEFTNIVEVKEEIKSFQKEGKEVECPNYWGGYEVSINEIEFWSLGENRFHDRSLYQRDELDWKEIYLYP